MIVLLKTNASAADSVWQSDYEYKSFDPNYLGNLYSNDNDNSIT